jgi:uncharacterized protein
MILDLRTLQEAGGRVSGRDRVEFEDAFGETAAVDCDVDVGYTRRGVSFYLHVHLRAAFATLCHACLEPVVQPLDGDFDLVIRRGADRAATLVGEDESGDDYVTVGEKEYEVSLHPFVHENLVVAIPIRILCREDCRGLCPECGANLNRGECSCQPAADPRWDALRKLSKD